MPQTDLQIKIKQVLEGGNQLKELRKNVTDLKATLFTLEQQGQKNTAQYKQFENALVSASGKLRAHTSEMKNLTGASKSSGAGMMQFAGQFGMVITGINQGLEIVKKLADAFVDLLKVAKVGAEFNVLKRGFDDLSGGVENSADSLELFDKALAGNLPTKKVMELANSFRLLGESDTEIAQFFDIAESRTELFGGSVETAISQLQRFIETGSKKGALGLKMDISAIEKEMKNLGNTTDEGIKKMSAEDQQILRKQAVYKLYGKSLDEIKQKKKDEADAIQALFTLYENLKTSISSLVSTALKPFIGFINDIIDYIKDLNVSFDDLLDKFPEIENSLNALGKVFQRFGQDAFNSITKFIDANVILVQAAAQIISDIITTNINAFILLIKGMKEVVAFSNKFSSVIGITIDDSGFDAFLRNLEALKSTRATLPPTRSKGVIIDDNGNTRTTGTNKSGKNKDEEIEKNVAIDYKKNAMAFIALQNVIDITTLKAKTLDDTIVVLKQRIISETSSIKQGLDVFSQGAVSAISNLFGALVPEQGQDTPFKSFMKNIVSTFLSSVQAMILGANAALIAKGITTFGISLIADAPMLAAAWVALEAAKGFVGGFATGGYVSGNGTGTSDSIPAYLSHGEYVVNAKSTSKYLPLLEMLNNGGQSKGYAFATGGLVRTGSNAGTTILISSDAAAFIKTTKMANNRIQQTNKWKRF